MPCSSSRSPGRSTCVRLATCVAARHLRLRARASGSASAASSSRRRRGGARPPSRPRRSRASRCRPSGCRAGSAAGRPRPCPRRCRRSAPGAGPSDRADHGRLLRAAEARAGGRVDRLLARADERRPSRAARRRRAGRRTPSAESGWLKARRVRGRPAPRVRAHQLRVRVDRHDRPLPAARWSGSVSPNSAPRRPSGTKSVRCTVSPFGPGQVHLRVARAGREFRRRPDPLPVDAEPDAVEQLQRRRPHAAHLTADVPSGRRETPRLAADHVAARAGLHVPSVVEPIGGGERGGRLGGTGERRA